MSSRISQAEAHRLRADNRRLRRILQAQRTDWVRDYPGIHIATEPDATPGALHSIKTARRLGHAVVAIEDMTAGEIMFVAIPSAREDV